MGVVGVATRTLCMAAATCLWLGVHGCVDVNGGAVELSWKLRPRSSSLEDKFVDCDSMQPGTGVIERMRLDWSVGDVHGIDTWPCSDSHGVTGFELPEGRALLSVTPVCRSGLLAAPGAYIAPAAEQRTVNLGDTVSLGAVELVLQVTDCGVSHCICE